MDISTLAALMSPPDLSGCRTVLCIQPHPDDNEVGIGGTIASFAQQGCEIHYLTVTNGDLGALDEQLSSAGIAAIRASELEAAGRLLGATVFHQLDHGDGTLEHIPALAGEIAEIIRTVQPDAILCPDPWLSYEAHYDHIVTGRAAAQAVLSSGLPLYPRVPLPGHGSRRPSASTSPLSLIRSSTLRTTSSASSRPWPCTSASSMKSSSPCTGSISASKAASWPKAEALGWAKG